MDIKTRYLLIKNKEHFREELSKKVDLKEHLLISYFSKNYCPKKYESLFNDFLYYYTEKENNYFKSFGIQTDVSMRSEQFYCFNNQHKRIDRCEKQCTACNHLKLMK